MSAEVYISFLDKQLAAFNEALAQLKESPDSDKIHEARLRRKRISATLRWVGEISDSFDSRKNIHRTRDIFSALGDVRDLQIIQKTGAQYAPEPSPAVQEFLDACKEAEAEAVAELMGEMEMYTAETSEKIGLAVRKALKKSGETDFDIAADKHLYRLFRNLRRVARNTDHEKALHRLRARIKEVPYFLEIMEAASHPCTLSEDQVKAAEEMGDRLGKWHDLVLFDDVLRKWMKKNLKHMEAGDAERFQAIKAQVKTDLKAVLELIAPAPAPKDSDGGDEHETETNGEVTAGENGGDAAPAKVKVKKKGNGKRKKEEVPAGGLN